jgi:hypothetical protein
VRFFQAPGAALQPASCIDFRTCQDEHVIGDDGCDEDDLINQWLHCHPRKRQQPTSSWKRQHAAVFLQMPSWHSLSSSHLSQLSLPLRSLGERGTAPSLVAFWLMMKTADLSLASPSGQGQGRRWLIVAHTPALGWPLPGKSHHHASSSNKHVTLKSKGRLLAARNAFFWCGLVKCVTSCVGCVMQGCVPLSFDEGPCHGMQHDIVHDKWIVSPQPEKASKSDSIPVSMCIGLTELIIRRLRHSLDTHKTQCGLAFQCLNTTDSLLEVAIPLIVA